MTRKRSARLAGVTYLVYTAAGIGHEFLMHQAMNAEGEAAKLASIASHAMDVRVAIVLTVVECLSALVLAVALYGITRDQDPELATLGLACRVAEGVLVSTAIPELWQLLWLANGTAAGTLDASTASALRAYLLMPGPSVPVASIFFAVGSTIFCYLLLRGRMVPGWLAWLGVLSSALLVVTLPLQIAGFSTGPVSGYYQWLPPLLFQLVLAPWLLIKGVAASTSPSPAI
jgi:uncharacterized protein DUF4386